MDAVNIGLLALGVVAGSLALGLVTLWLLIRMIYKGD